ENRQLRTELLEHHIIKAKKIELFACQAEFNAHDLAYGRRLLGLTGTLNADCLPDQCAPDVDTVRPKTVVARQILQATMAEDPVVYEVEGKQDLQDNEAFNCCIDLINQGYMGIINQGFAFGGATSQAFVEQLRLRLPHRTYVFVSGTDGERVFYQWRPGAETPEPIAKSRLRELQTQAKFRSEVCCCFSPSDIRGTDIPLPPGKLVAMIGDKCLLSDFVQLLGRPRNAGRTQNVGAFIITKATGNRIRGGENRPSTAADLLADIDRQSAETLEPMNTKTGSEGLRRTTVMGTRDLLTNVYNSPGTDDTLTGTVARLEHTKLRHKLYEIANSPDMGWLLKRSRVDMESDLAPLLLKDSLDVFEPLYKIQQGRLEQLKSEIRESGNDSAASRQLLEQIEQLLQQLDERWLWMKAKIEAQRANVPKQSPGSHASMPLGTAVVQQQQQQQQ
ncbi:MAG: hypothetical protein KDK78_00225, partial [Chlamydiia bacterium]|nr:hypothetical protein [Chlamydiia bacterium]